MSRSARSNVRTSQAPMGDPPAHDPPMHTRRRMLMMMAGLAASSGFVLYRAHAQAAGFGAAGEAGSLRMKPRRGAIYDRHGTLLAISLTLYRVKIDPATLRRAREDDAARAKTEEALAAALGMALPRLRSQLDGRTLVVPVSPIQARRVAQLELARAGVSIVARPCRVYPAGRLAAHVVGYLGGNGEGADGIERAYNTQLRGATDALAVVRDGRGRPILTDGAIVDQTGHGQSVFLTLDATLQEAVERALRSQVDAVQARAGHVVVLDPARGEVLALASHPTFHPAHRGDVDADARRNRAVAERFEPGSVVKTFTIAGALEAGAIDLDQRIDCQKGQMRIGPVVIHDAHPHGLLTPGEILARSSNIGTAKIAAALGRAGLHRILRQFGFGARTGIDLPGEVEGALRPHASWGAVDAAAISFGQGMSASNVQLAAAMAAIANGGMLVQPHLVARVVEAEGRTRAHHAPSPRQRVVRAEVARSVAKMLVAVTERGGTGEAAALAGVAVAGKTGTAQQAAARGGYAGGTWTSSFVGFAPAEHPRAIVSVVIDAPRRMHAGGATAGPVFRAIAAALLRPPTAP